MLSTSLLYGAWLEGFSKERERGGCNDSRFSRACLMALIYIEYSANFCHFDRLGGFCALSCCAGPLERAV